MGGDDGLVTAEAGDGDDLPIGAQVAVVMRVGREGLWGGQVTVPMLQKEGGKAQTNLLGAISYRKVFCSVLDGILSNFLQNFVTAS